MTFRKLVLILKNVKLILNKLTNRKINDVCGGKSWF